jgi:hypothetical protein
MAREPVQDNAIAQTKSSSIWKRIADKLGINIPILLMMIKYATAHWSASF